MGVLPNPELCGRGNAAVGRIVRNGPSREQPQSGYAPTASARRPAQHVRANATVGRKKHSAGRGRIRTGRRSDFALRPFYEIRDAAPTGAPTGTPTRRPRRRRSTRAGSSSAPRVSPPRARWRGSRSARTDKPAGRSSASWSAVPGAAPRRAGSVRAERAPAQREWSA